MSDLDFPAGSMLTIKKQQGYDAHGDPLGFENGQEIGPCSIVATHGQVQAETNGNAKWVGTVDVQAPPETQIHAGDKVQLPNGTTAVVVSPPERPRNPFTGWQPFTKFTLSSPGYTPEV